MNVPQAKLYTPKDCAASPPGPGSARLLLSFGRCFLRRLTAGRSLGLAAEMAFWLFMSLLPLAAVAGLITAKFAWGNPSTTAPLLESLPVATRALLRDELGRVAAWNAGSVGIGAGLMFIWLNERQRPPANVASPLREVRARVAAQ